MQLDFFFEMQWPRDNLYVNCFAHQILNYRYHWHPDQYELNILLCGNQEFCRDQQNVLLEEDDVILVGPGVGHASFAQQANTRALVLHISASAFRAYLKKGFCYAFPSCLSSAATRGDERYRLIRFYAAQIYEAACQGGPYAQLTAKAGTEMLLSTLCRLFDPQTIPAVPEQEEQQQALVRHLIAYIEQHYTEKLTLEDLAGAVQYNRTYLSTLFKNAVGVNFHEYLMRVRFQQALSELATTQKNLTEIAIDNGFSDLKSFNSRFREILHRTPAEYRAQLMPGQIAAPLGQRKYIAPSDALVQKKLDEYAHLA
jgi:AraC-like DNA-binding protein